VSTKPAILLVPPFAPTDRGGVVHNVTAAEGGL
jgi:hypothetical protein